MMSFQYQQYSSSLSSIPYSESEQLAGAAVSVRSSAFQLQIANIKEKETENSAAGLVKFL